MFYPSLLLFLYIDWIFSVHDYSNVICSLIVYVSSVPCIVKVVLAQPISFWCKFVTHFSFLTVLPVSCTKAYVFWKRYNLSSMFLNLSTLVCVCVFPVFQLMPHFAVDSFVSGASLNAYKVDWGAVSSQTESLRKQKKNYFILKLYAHYHVT